MKSMGTCSGAGLRGNEYGVAQKHKSLSKTSPTACIASKSGALLWYKSNANAPTRQSFLDFSFTVTSVGNVRLIALPSTGNGKKAAKKVNGTKATTTTIPKILHYIPSSFPASVPRPPGNLSGAYAKGNPNYVWIVITAPQNTSDVVSYLTSLKQLGFKPYGVHYTNYTTTLRNGKYQITVSYETLGPSVVEMTTSLGLLKG